jgi:hypothetical protein
MFYASAEGPASVCVGLILPLASISTTPLSISLVEFRNRLGQVVRVGRVEIGWWLPDGLPVLIDI